MDSGFWAALLSSPTFWSSAGVWALLAVACAAIAVVMGVHLLGRMRPRDLHRSDEGAAVAVDFVLVLPLFVVFISLLLQFAMLMNAAMVVHYAAYSAARSARVFAFEQGVAGIVPQRRCDDGRPLRHERWTKPCVGGPVQEMAERAARFALMAASPSNPDLAGSDTSTWISALADNSSLGELNARTEAIRAKAAYAFDPANSVVTLEVLSEPEGDGVLPSLGIPIAAHYVEARVDFEFYLPLFPAFVFQPVTQREGRYFKTIEATMRVF